MVNTMVYSACYNCYMNEALHTDMLEPLDGNELIKVAKQKGWTAGPPIFYGEGENERGIVMMIGDKRISRSALRGLKDSMPEPATPRDRISVEGVKKSFHRGRKPFIKFTGSIAALGEVIDRLPLVEQL